MIAGCKNSHIPSSVTSLGEYCFWDCTGLTSITIPSSVTSLGYRCFRDCTGLTSITIPSSVTSLGVECFGHCTGLTSITIPNSVTRLRDACFWGCTGLTSITIPSSVTRLGDYCFRNCISLEEITMLPTTVPYASDYIFRDTPLRTIYVANDEAKALYQAASPWNKYDIVSLNIVDGVSQISSSDTAPQVTGYYDLSGRRLTGKQRGVVIERYADGTSRKVLVK